MKKLLLLASASFAFSAIAAAPVSAQNVTGTLNLTGSVAASCAVTAGSNTSTHSFGELAGTGGTLSSTMTGYTAATTPATMSFTVNCNTAAPGIAITASQLADALGTPPTGYADAINYTAEADLVETTGSVPFTATTLVPLAHTVLANPLANSTNNVTIKAYGFTTVGSPADLLMAGTGYAGTVTVTITPS